MVIKPIETLPEKALISELLAKHGRYGITFFSTFYGTEPTHELPTATVRQIADMVCDDAGPMIIDEKDDGLYFVPCALRVAPLVEKTLARALQRGLPTTGKMRSANHVSAGAWSKIDGDGLTDEQFADVQKKLDTSGIAHIIYSTHSHGRADKPGIRCRIIIFFDKALESVEYQQAVLSLSRWLLGQPLDMSEARLYQQAGVWCAHPGRVDQAFRFCNLEGHCVSTEALLAANPIAEPKRLQLEVAYSAPGDLDADHVRGALKFLDPNGYTDWFNARAWLKSAYGDAAYPLWLDWSQTATDKHRATLEECAKAWGDLKPRIPAGAGAGKLFGAARDAAVEVVRQASKSKQWGAPAKEAVIYIKRYHARLYDQITRKVAA